MIRKNTKRLIGVLMAIVIVFSFVGCQSLQTYKSDAKIKLDNYVSELSFFEGGKPIKNHINGPAFDKIVDNGQNSIDKASNKKAVNKALDKAKKSIKAIPIVFRSDTTTLAIPPMSIALLTSIPAYLYMFYLKRFDENVSFEYRADAGIMLDYDISDEPFLDNDYEFFGRHPKCVPWYGKRAEQNGSFVLPRQVFIDFIIKINDIIIGYMLVEMYVINTGYAPKLLAFVLNSKINGEYQAMDEQDLKTDIEIIKNENKFKEEF